MSGGERLLPTFLLGSCALSPFTEGDIETSFDSQVVERARRYMVGGHVLSAALRHDGVYIGSVNGSDAHPYLVHMQLAPNSFMPLVTKCSCPFQFQCKHGAALALAILTGDVEVTRAAFIEPERKSSAPEPEVPHELSDWISSVAKSSADPMAEPPGAKASLVYVLAVDESRFYGSRAMLTVVSRSHLKDGTLGKAIPYSLNGAQNGQFQQHVSAHDRSVITDMVRNGQLDFSNRGAVRLDGAHATRIIDAAVKSGRCRWKDPESEPLRHGEVRSGVIGWDSLKNGDQRPALRLTPPAEVLPIEPLRYVDPSTGEVGAIDCGLPHETVRALLRAPAIRPEHADLVTTELAALGLAEAALPTPAGPIDHVRVSPTVHLDIELLMCDTRDYLGRTSRVPVPFARLAFDYNGERLRPSDKTEVRRTVGGILRILHRDKEVESHAVRVLESRGWYLAKGAYSVEIPSGRGTDYVLASTQRGRFGNLTTFDNFMSNDVPSLRDMGWIVETIGGVSYALPDQVQWEVALEGDSGTDWFELKLGIRVGDSTFDLRSVLPQLLPAARRQPTGRRLWQPEPASEVFVTLDNGTIVMIPRDRVMALVGPIAELFGDASEWPANLQLPRSLLVEADALANALGDAGATWKSSQELEALRRRLRNFSELEPAPAPQDFVGELRDYQRQGLAWLQFLREYEFGGILADDMGLGKTIQVLAHIQTEKLAGRLDRPCLVVTPTSTIPNWMREAARFTPELRVIKLHGAARKSEYQGLASADIALTNYAILARDKSELTNTEFHLVVLDEAQNVKNAATAGAKAARDLRARHRLALSGTPVENHLGELWSLFHFLMPGFLGSQHEFRKQFRTPIEQRNEQDVAAKLGRRIKPFMLRRTKSQVATELPPITEIVETVDLGDEQRDLYESVRIAMDARVRQLLSSQGLDKSRIQILDALLKLRQVCCDPHLVKLDAAQAVADSAKLERLRDMLGVLIEDGRRVLIFSQFTSMLDLIEPVLEAMDVKWVRISGDTVDRDTPVQRFQAGEVPVFLISLKAGGTGLNLVAADTVIHYDPWWNPAVERQATDRAHRIGQDKPVMVYKLVAAGTVEEKILDLQKRKGALADQILAGAEDAASALRQEDLTWLLSDL